MSRRTPKRATHHRDTDEENGLAEFDTNPLLFGLGSEDEEPAPLANAFGSIFVEEEDAETAQENEEENSVSEHDEVDEEDEEDENGSQASLFEEGSGGHQVSFGATVVLEAPASPCSTEVDTDPLLLETSLEEAASNAAIAFGSIMEMNDETETTVRTRDDEDDDTDNSDIEAPLAPDRRMSERMQSVRHTRLAAVALGTGMFGAFLGATMIDEDDVIAAAAIVKTVAGGGGGTGGAAVTAKAVCVQQMAVGAAQGAANSVATGNIAATAAAAGGGGAAGSTASNVGQGTVVTTAVAGAVAAGLVLSGGDGAPLCPNVPIPEIQQGRMTVDFLGTDLITSTQARELGAKFADTYNNVMGCDSEYSRLILNCSIPCELADDNSTLCCDFIEDGLFGSLMRCQFDCFVHCDGCAESEPLFLVNNLNETTLPDFASNGSAVFEPLSKTPTPSPSLLNTSLDDNRFLLERDFCTPQCQLAKAMNETVCGRFFNESNSCIAVRSDTYDIRLQDDQNAQKETVTLVPLPTALPSVSPSAFPSSTPTMSPSTMSPSVLPSSTPSTRPSAAIFEDLVVYKAYDSDIPMLGSLIDATILIAALGASLTVKAEVSRPVESVEFYFDDEFVREESSAPYFIQGETQGGVPHPFNPMGEAGSHNVTAVAFDDMKKQLGSITALFTVL